MAGASECVKGWMLSLLKVPVDAGVSGYFRTWMNGLMGVGGCRSGWMLQWVDAWIDGAFWMREWGDAWVDRQVVV